MYTIIIFRDLIDILKTNKIILNSIFKHGMLFFGMSIFCLMWLSLSYAIEDEDIPDELQDWTGWVLKDEPTVSCPIAYNHN